MAMTHTDCFLVLSLSMGRVEKAHRLEEAVCLSVFRGCPWCGDCFLFSFCKYAKQGHKNAEQDKERSEL